MSGVRAVPGARVEEAHPLARQLREVRRDAGRTLRDVASVVGVTPGTLCGYEMGQRDPSVGVLDRWASALGLQVALVEGVHPDE